MKKFNEVYKRIMESVKDFDDGESISLFKIYLKKYGKNLKYDKHAIRYIDKSAFNSAVSDEEDESEVDKVIPFSEKPVDPTDKDALYSLHQGSMMAGDLIIFKLKDGSYHLEVNTETKDENYTGIVITFDNKNDITDFFKKNGATNLVSHL